MKGYSKKGFADEKNRRVIGKKLNQKHHRQFQDYREEVRAMPEKLPRCKRCLKREKKNVDDKKMEHDFNSWDHPYGKPKYPDEQPEKVK